MTSTVIICWVVFNSSWWSFHFDHSNFVVRSDAQCDQIQSSLGGSGHSTIYLLPSEQGALDSRCGPKLMDCVDKR